MFREKIVAVLAAATGKKSAEIESMLTVPPQAEMGDFAFPCFIFAKEVKKAPQQIASDLAKTLAARSKRPSYLEKVEAQGPYLNFFIKPSALAGHVIETIQERGDSYGLVAVKNKNAKTIVLEYPSPNTNKPLHLGHVGNILLGSSLARLFKACGHTVYRVNLNNDRGIHICKSMLAYQKFGHGETPNKKSRKSDHFVGDYYVLFAQKAKNDPHLEEEAQEILVKWEAGDPKALAVWKKMNA